MFFNYFPFPSWPFTKPSTHPKNPFSKPTRNPSVHSDQLNNKIATGRIFAGHAFALTNGIKPIPSPLRNRCIHTRPKTGNEGIFDLHEALGQTESDLKALQRLRQRQKQNELIIRKASFLEREMEMEEHKREVQDLEAKVEHWRTISNGHEQKLFEIGEHVLVLTDTALTSARMVHTLKAQRDKARALFAREKELVEDAENRRKVAVSSLRQRCNEEKEPLQDEIQELREALRSKDEKIAELEAACKAQKDEAQRRQMALCDCVEEIDMISDRISCISSEMLEFMPMQPDKDKGVWEKMRDLQDGIKDLVREVKTRRENSKKMSERIYTLEEERLMWTGGR